MRKRHRLEKAIRTGQLLGRFFLHKTSAEENAQVDTWRDQAERNKRLLEKIGEEDILQSRIHLYNRLDPREEWKKLKLPPVSVARPGYYPWAIAASVLVFLSLGAYWLFKTPDPAGVIYAEIQPGNYKAILYTSPGRQIHIQENSNLLVKQDSSVRIADNQLVYSTTQTDPAQNILEVPRGGEFKIRLADGSEVWINSGSTLKYPSAFNAGERIVELDGEAYFIVAPSKEQPFIIKTRQSAIQVYGTAFNVCAYSEDPIEYTTLEHGSIGLLAGREEKRLQPGEQAVLNKNGEIRIQKVNAQKYGSWRNGAFLFEKEQLGNIMLKLSRWYDVDVFFMDKEAKHLHFTGDLNRYEDIRPLLDMISLTTRISFTVHNRTIIVESK